MLIVADSKFQKHLKFQANMRLKYKRCYGLATEAAHSVCLGEVAQPLPLRCVIISDMLRGGSMTATLCRLGPGQYGDLRTRLLTVGHGAPVLVTQKPEMI